MALADLRAWFTHAAGQFRAEDPWLAPGVTLFGQWPGVTLHSFERDAAGHLFAWASRGTSLLRAMVVSGADIDWQHAGTVPERCLPTADRVLGAADGATAIAPGLQHLTSHLANAARSGIHQLVTLPSGTRLVGLNGKMLRWTASGDWSVALTYNGFRKPARWGVLADRQGRAWIAQYALNPQRTQTITLYRSTDDGRTFVPARVFAAGEVRHLHFVQQDPVDGSLWLGSGDRDSESAIWRSIDGDQWQRVGGGDQAWRAIGLAFLADAVVWGTDAGSDAEHFANVALRWDRANGQLRAEQAVAAPVHGVGALHDGRVVLTTGSEGGANEPDRAVHVWLRAQTGSWTEIARFSQGWQPRRVAYAVAHLADGQSNCTDLWLQLRGTAHMPLGIARLSIDFAGDT